MHIRTERVGTVPASHGGGSPVDAYTLDNGEGLSATVWTFGATLVEVRYPGRSGAVDNLVLRLPSLDDYLDRARNPYLGASMGRFCRSVAHGTFELDGVRHRLARNDGPHHLHGGPDGYDRRVWRGRAEERADELSVVLDLHSPDLDQGYPGAVDARCVYRIDRADRLTVEYTATTSASTVLGLTNHTFWNLAGDGLVDDHRLRLAAGSVLPFDEQLMPLAGPAVPVEGGPLDFGRARAIGATRIDNFFVLDNPDVAVELGDPGSGRHLRVRTDQSGLGVYSGDGLPWPRAGLCLQTSAWPDAPNRPDYPSARLDPGQTYRHQTVFELSVR